MSSLKKKYTKAGGEIETKHENFDRLVFHITFGCGKIRELHNSGVSTQVILIEKVLHTKKCYNNIIR